MKYEKLLVVSRAKFVRKNNTVYFNLGDGFYIDEISNLFQTTTILASETIYSNSIYETYQFKNKIHCIDRNSYSNKWFLLKLPKLIKLIMQYDVVFLFYPVQFSLLVAIISSFLGIKVIAYNGGVWSEAKTFLTNNTIKKSLRIVFFNLLENLSIKFSDFYLVNNNTLLKKNKKNKKVIKAAALLRIEKDKIYTSKDLNLNSKLRILNVNHIKPGKGIIELIEGFSMFRKSVKYETELIIVGDTTKEKEYFKHILKVIEDLAEQSTITFTGNINSLNELIDIYRTSDFFVLPSISEGFPRVIWEAFSQSLPVISTSIPNITLEFDEDRMPLLLIPDNKPNSIKKGMQEMSSNKDLREKLVYDGRFYLNKKMANTPSKQIRNVLLNLS